MGGPHLKTILHLLLLRSVGVASFCWHRCNTPSTQRIRSVFIARQNQNTIFATTKAEEHNDDNEDKQRKASGVNQTESSLATCEPGVLMLQQQAAALRAEASCIEKDLRASQEAKQQKEIEDIDRWIEECLYVQVKAMKRNQLSPAKNKEKNEKNHAEDTTTIATRVELLNDVETAAQILRDNRFSHEQVSKMFERICDTSPAQSRSNCSPLLALLVDAAGKLDCVEREDNPNKRWDGKVERDLRKRLFAMDWRLNLDTGHQGDDRFV